MIWTTHDGVPGSETNGYNGWLVRSMKQSTAGRQHQHEWRTTASKFCRWRDGVYRETQDVQYVPACT
jgi:hypothetical protein